MPGQEQKATPKQLDGVAAHFLTPTKKTNKLKKHEVHVRNA